MRLLTSALVLSALGFACGTESTSHPVVRPVLLSVTPNSILIGSTATTIHLGGTDFVAQSRVRWNDADLPTSFISATELTAEIDAARLAIPGEAAVAVVNPDPGGASGTIKVVVHYPVPHITSLSPDHSSVGDTGVSFAVQGTGFIPQTRVSWGGFELTPASRTATTIVVPIQNALLNLAKNVEVTVFNPVPDGGQSNGLTFHVRNPVPVITAIEPDSVDADRGDFAATITGDRFIASARVKVNGVVRDVNVLSPTRLTVPVTAADIATPGVLSVVVENPSPSDGPSLSSPLKVAEAPPRIVGLNPSVVAPGSPGFTLKVTGVNFGPSAILKWNGAARLTTVLSSTALTALIGAGDVAAAGTGAIIIANPGRASAAGYVAITAPASTLSSNIEVPVVATDLASAPGRGRLYATIGGSAPNRTNSVIAIDPTSGAIVDSLPVSGDPGPVAITDDERYLYVVLRGSPSIARIDLQLWLEDLRFPLGNGQNIGDPAFGEDVETVPSHPHSVVVSLRNTCCSPRHEGVAIYDDGVRRPNLTPPHTGSNRIVVASASRAYGLNNENTEFGFRRIWIDAAGLREDGEQDGLAGAFGVDMELDGGVVFLTTGAIIDPERLLNIGSLPAGGALRPDAHRGRVHLLVSPNELRTYHYLSGALLGSVVVPNAVGVTRMTRWGADGLALVATDRLVLIRTPLAAP